MEYPSFTLYTNSFTEEIPEYVDNLGKVNLVTYSLSEDFPIHISVEVDPYQLPPLQVYLLLVQFTVAVFAIPAPPYTGLSQIMPVVGLVGAEEPYLIPKLDNKVPPAAVVPVPPFATDKVPVQEVRA